MKKKRLWFFGCLLALVVWSISTNAQVNPYIQRFLDLRQKIYDPANGYFSKDGVPYHSVETLICEAPDHGHETTSEAYSYWIWLESMYGGITGDWAPLNAAWQKMETFAIPNANQQPTAGSYNPNSPATFAAEHPLPNDYPSILESGVPVGKDPISPDLTAAYGANIYGTHWLFDCDNFYGYGNMGDGVSTPSYINTFQLAHKNRFGKLFPTLAGTILNGEEMVAVEAFYNCLLKMPTLLSNGVIPMHLMPMLDQYRLSSGPYSSLRNRVRIQSPSCLPQKQVKWGTLFVCRWPINISSLWAFSPKQLPELQDMKAFTICYHGIMHGAAPS